MPGVTEMPSLFFRQRLLLALLAGSISVRGVATGVALFLLILFLPEKRRRPVLLLAAFLVGVVLTVLASPRAPDSPSWASVPGKYVLAEGRVASVSGLPGGRARVLLEELRPLKVLPPLPEKQAEAVQRALGRKPPLSMAAGPKDYPGSIVEDSSAPVPGLVSLTLYEKDVASCGRPVQGQRLRALLRLYPVSGSVNPGTSDLRTYWADRDVWHNARPGRTKDGPVFLEMTEGTDIFARAFALRETWRTAMLNVLAPGDASPAGQEGLSQGRAMLVALLFGDRSLLSPNTVDLFTRAGLVHSLALSGQHLALAAMAGTLFILLLSRLWNGLFLLTPRRVLVVSAGLPFALAYLFLGGAPFSLIRAAFMMLAAAFFLCLRRASAPLDALFAAAFLLFLFRPLAVFDLSAQLSVLAVAGILLCLPFVVALQRRFASKEDGRLLPWPRRVVHALVRWTGTMLLLSCAAQLAVLPVLVEVFGVVNLNFWMNVVWLPPLTFVTLPCAALGLLLLGIAPQVSSLLFSVAARPADGMLGLLEALDSTGWLPFIQCPRPHPLSCLGYGAALAALLLLAQARLAHRRPGPVLTRLLVAGLLLMPAGQLPTWADAIRAHREGRVALTVFDVGQGQALLLEYPGGRMLVDGGGSASPFFDVGRSILAPALTAGRLPHLDAVMVSHADMDHARGLRWILEHFEVDRLYWSRFSAEGDSTDGRALREILHRRNIPEEILAGGDVLSLAPGLHLEVLWPERDATRRPDRKTERNDLSLAVRLVRDGKGLAMLCGDMTSSALRSLARSGRNLQAQVLVLPHHGAASSFQKAFYDAVAPEAAFASAAAFNHYGFPAVRVRKEMAARRVPLYSTSVQGGLRVTWTRGGGMNVPPRAGEIGLSPKIGLPVSG